MACGGAGGNEHRATRIRGARVRAAAGRSATAADQSSVLSRSGSDRLGV